MSSSASWPLIQTPVTPTTTSNGTNNTLTDQSITVFGRGLTIPFQLNGVGDYNTATGNKLIESYVRQIIGTRATSANKIGELPYNPEFGSLLYLLRHSSNDAVASELARVYIGDALKRWAPSVRVTHMEVSAKTTRRRYDTLDINLRYSVLNRSSQSTAETLFFSVKV